MNVKGKGDGPYNRRGSTTVFQKDDKSRAEFTIKVLLRKNWKTISERGGVG